MLEGPNLKGIYCCSLPVLYIEVYYLLCLSRKANDELMSTDNGFYMKIKYQILHQQPLNESLSLFPSTCF